jgi:hypothetical protein
MFSQWWLGRDIMPCSPLGVSVLEGHVSTTSGAETIAKQMSGGKLSLLGSKLTTWHYKLHCHL